MNAPAYCHNRIRPAWPIQPWQIECELKHGHPGPCAGMLRDVAHPGSATRIIFDAGDRRTFTGPWLECPVRGCVLPAGHPRGHAS